MWGPDVARLTNNSARPFGLLLCNYSINQGTVVAESINAFHDYSRFPYLIYSRNHGFDEGFDFDAFDFMVIHYSIIPSLPGFLSGGLVERIRRFKGLKLQMIQDDFRMNSLLVRFIKQCGIDVVYTVAPPLAAKALYSDKVPGLDVETYLTGYISNWLKLEEPIPLRKRSYDVGYRGRKYPYWFGQPVIDKVELADVVAKKLARNGLRCNFSTREKDRVYGRAWVDFLRSCRAIFGMETDMHYVDRQGYLHHWYDTMEKLYGPKRWDGKEALQYPFFKEHAQPVPSPLAVIPPRVFETIAVRSANVLVEGQYSGIIEPWRHYIPLKKDLSNVNDVIRALRDTSLLIDVTSVAFAEIAQNRTYTYEGFADQIDGTIERHMHSRPRGRLRGGNHTEWSANGGVKDGESPHEIDTVDVEALEKAAPFYHLGNPNTLSIKNPSRRKFLPIRQWRQLIARGIRHVMGR